MIDECARNLDANLALLPLATQRVLRQASLPSIRLDGKGDQLAASVRTSGGHWVPVHGNNDPLAASKSVAERFAASNPPLIVVIGLGLGYLLDALEATGCTSRVLAIEPLPTISRAMLARRSWSSWLASERLTIVAGPDYNGASEASTLFGQGGTTPPVIMAPLLEREFGEEGRRGRAVVGHIVAGAKANDAARRQFAGRYLLNTLRNVPTIATEGDVDTLFDIFQGIPAFVVAAGPSLDRTLRDLARLEGRGLIIAVDTALRPLLSAGIHPHVVVSVDPSELNARHLKDLPEAARGTWLVAEGSIDRDVFPQFAGRTFTFKVSHHHPWPYLEDSGIRRATLRTWGSVLTTAFDLAVRAGCDPIVFTGADLAYTDGLQYCRNTTYEEKWRDFPTDARRAEVFKAYLAEKQHLTASDIRGREVVTAPHFLQFRDWIVSRANEAADRHIVNATGGGILSGGRITQGDLRSLHLPKRTYGPAFDRLLHDAWSIGAARNRVAVTTLETRLHSQPRPMAAWVEFGGETATVEQIAAAADSASARLHREAQISAYLSACAANADAHATTLEDAQTWIHPNYTWARLQAEGQQAHVLLDHLQRTHDVVAPPDARAIVDSATAGARSLRILEVGCGLGRTMEALVSAGHDVDGVDISQQMIDLAQRSPLLATSTFFVGRGDNCGAAPDGAYDIATLHLTLHLIKSRVVRRSLLQAIARTLKPEGTFFAQMPFYADYTSASVPAPHVSWSSDLGAAPIVMKGHVCPTADALGDMLSDFGEAFRDIRFQFIDFPPGTVRNDERRPLQHILVTGSRTHTLAVRMYALPTTAPTRRDAILRLAGGQRQQ